MNKIQAIRGMNDLLPSETPVWQYLEATVSELLQSYGYQEIRFPVLEKTELFARGIGEVTDIVEKEMYTFLDRNDESLTLRPEGTACCVRAAEQHQLLYNRGNLIQKLWYIGPMYRYEKPQKGRLREFHQIGVETFGLAGPDIDAELLLMTARLWRTLGIEKDVKLQLNCLGTSACRNAHRQALVSYLEQFKHELDEDSQRRLHKSPLRILDSKDKNTQLLLNDAPKLTEYLCDESKAHFDGVQKILRAAGIDYEVNPKLVRGLDYYSNTVFEWVTDRLGAQGTVCAGGRYDSLIEQLGGKPTQAVGFGMGLERLVLLLQELNVIPAEIYQNLDVYLVAVGDVQTNAFVFGEYIRENLPHIRLQVHCGGGNFKNQMKKADKSGAAIALILGEDEVRDGTVGVKYLLEDKPQETLKQQELLQLLA